MHIAFTGSAPVLDEAAELELNQAAEFASAALLRFLRLAARRGADTAVENLRFTYLSGMVADITITYGHQAQH